MARNRGQSAVDVVGAETCSRFCLWLTLRFWLKMAKFSFYKELDRLSTADFYRENKKKKASASRLYEIDRVISKRVRKGKVSDCLYAAFVLQHAIVNDLF